MENDVKYIYLITNLINGKRYVGQSKKPHERWMSHCAPSGTSLVSRAIHKYGKENFNFTIIEGPISNYNDRERYWIKKYNSQVPNGYNIESGGTKGGEGLRGEDNPTSIYSKDQIDYVIDLLKNTKDSFSVIAAKANINSIQTINYINQGKQWFYKNEKYPIRMLEKDRINSQLQNIILLLKKGIPEYEIERRTGVGHSLIDKINKGVAYRQDNLVYPIRRANETTNKKNKLIKAKKVVELLKTTQKPLKEIAKEADVSLSTVYVINSGTQYSYLNESYPIRHLS